MFVDPENTNSAAIRAYEKAGFKKIESPSNTKDTWMIKTLKNNLNLKYRKATIDDLPMM